MLECIVEKNLKSSDHPRRNDTEREITQNENEKNCSKLEVNE